MNYIYLDNNASMPLLPGAGDAMHTALEVIGNPSAMHHFGRTARMIREEARRIVAGFLDAAPQEVVWTSSGSEANNWLLQKFPMDHLITSEIEHVSILKNCPSSTTLIPVSAAGVVDLGALQSALDAAKGRVLVSLMAANNETGVLQPIQEAATLVAARPETWFHVDAVQILGKKDFSFRTSGAHFATFSAHKCGGPLGVGALLIRGGTALDPLIRGGVQETHRRAGTENMVGILGFAGALAHLTQHPIDWGQIETYRDDLEARIRHISGGSAMIFGAGVPRLPNTSCVGLPGVPSTLQIMRLDLEGIAVSAGSACSAGTIKTSHVLEAMGAGSLADQAIRVSLGWQTTQEDVCGFVKAWENLYLERQRSGHG